MTRHPITEQRLALRTAGMGRVRVDRDIPFGRNARGLAMDVYRPPGAAARPGPAVLFVTGYSDVGGRALLGCNLKDWAAYTDWARLVASSGMIAITYTNADPVRDARELLRHVEANAEVLGIDAARLGVWSCSGNVPTALALLQERDDFRCAVLCYGYLADLPGHDEVARACERFGFVNATAGIDASRSSGVPLLVVRAGRDEMPGLNASLDRFVAHALAANLPVSLVNHPDGPHAFDVSNETEGTRGVIRQILAYLRAGLVEQR